MERIYSFDEFKKMLIFEMNPNSFRFKMDISLDLVWGVTIHYTSSAIFSKESIDDIYNLYSNYTKFACKIKRKEEQQKQLDENLDLLN